MRQRTDSRILAPLMLMLMLTFSGCSSYPEQNPSSLRIDRTEVHKLASNFGCEEIQMIHADVYFFDKMTGFDCVLADKTPSTLFRVYEENTSPAQVLEDWDDFFTEEIQLLIGKNWFAIGTPSHLAEVANILDVGVEIGTSVPISTPPTERQVRTRECSVAIVTIVRDSVLKTDADPMIARSYEEFFPQIVKFSDSLASDISATGSFDDSSFEYEISTYGSRILDYCSNI